MADWVRRALSRKTKKQSVSSSAARSKSKKQDVVVVEADERLVYVVNFGIGMTICLTAVEIAHLVILKSWSSEVFAAITVLSGTVMGIFVGAKGSS